MENREASSHCSPLYGVAGRRDTSLSQTHSDIIPLKWAKILVLCTPNESPGVPFDYGNEQMLLWDFRKRILRENGRWSYCPLNLMLHCIRDILCTSLISLCPYRADCFVLAQTQRTGAAKLLGSVGSSWPLLCQLLSFWLLPPLWDWMKHHTQEHGIWLPKRQPKDLNDAMHRAGC